MASPAQIAANRRNALKSTGPRTARGKAVASRNAFQHGFRSRAASLPREDFRAFLQLLARFRAEYRPSHPAARVCVFRLSAAVWKLRRADRIEKQIYQQNSIVDAISRLAILVRYRGTFRRSFHRSVTQLHLFPNEANPATRRIEKRPGTCRYCHPVTNRPAGGPHGAGCFRPRQESPLERPPPGDLPVPGDASILGAG